MLSAEAAQSARSSAFLAPQDTHRAPEPVTDAGKAPDECEPECPALLPLKADEPKYYHQSLPAPLDQFWYNYASPNLPAGAFTDRSNLDILLRGVANPDEEFGGGMRISGKRAYLTGKICTTFSIDDPRIHRSGTVVGLYLLDDVLDGPRRQNDRWCEASFEWLGRADHLSSVETAIYPRGVRQPESQTFNLPDIGAVGGQFSPVRYCLAWDLRGSVAEKKYLQWTANLPGKPVAQIRRWSPPDDASNALWSRPMKPVFSHWASATEQEFLGVYDEVEGDVLEAHFQDIMYEQSGLV